MGAAKSIVRGGVQNWLKRLEASPDGGDVNHHVRISAPAAESRQSPDSFLPNRLSWLIPRNTSRSNPDSTPMTAPACRFRNASTAFPSWLFWYSSQEPRLAGSMGERRATFGCGRQAALCPTCFLAPLHADGGSSRNRPAFRPTGWSADSRPDVPEAPIVLRSVRAPPAWRKGPNERTRRS